MADHLNQTAGDPHGEVLVDNNNQVSQSAVLPAGIVYDFASVTLSRGGNLQVSAVSTNAFTVQTLRVKADSTLFLIPHNTGDTDYTNDEPFRVGPTQADQVEHQGASPGPSRAFGKFL